jgi:hypothetical protein
MNKVLNISQVSAPGPDWITTDLMVKIEDHYKANYCGCLQFKTKNGQWTPMPFPIFYQENTLNDAHHPYIALFKTDGKLMVTAAIGVDDAKWAAVYDRVTDKYLISNYSRGFRENTLGDYVDGGQIGPRAGGVHVYTLALNNGIWNVI